MTISELVKCLEGIKERHGDLKVFLLYKDPLSLQMGANDAKDVMILNEGNMNDPNINIVMISNGIAVPSAYASTKPNESNETGDILPKILECHKKDDGQGP